MASSLSLRKWQFLVFVLVPLVNFGVNIFFPGAFEDDIEVLIQPANYAFAIWGPIFLGMLIYAYFQMQKERVDSIHLRKATIGGILAGLASIVFVPLSYTDMQWLILLNIIWHLLALIYVYIHLSHQVHIETSPNKRWYYMPTQMYLGWICAATAVSVALFLKESGMSFLLDIELAYTAGVIVALIGVGVYMLRSGGSIVALVIVWALIALLVKYGEYAPIRYAAGAGVVILMTSIILQWRRKGPWMF